MPVCLKSCNYFREERISASPSDLKIVSTLGRSSGCTIFAVHSAQSRRRRGTTEKRYTVWFNTRAQTKYCAVSRTCLRYRNARVVLQIVGGSFLAGSSRRHHAWQSTNHIDVYIPRENHSNLIIRKFLFFIIWFLFIIWKVINF